MGTQAVDTAGPGGTTSADGTSGAARSGPGAPGGRDALLTAGAIAAAVAAYVVSASSGTARGRAHTVLLVLGALLAGTTVLLGALRERRTQRRLRTAEQVAVEAEAELMLTLNGALAPITNYLGDMADQRTTGGRATVAGQLSQAVVDAVVRLTADASRSAFYRLDDDWQGLTREVWGGRASQPRGAFVAGTPDGDAVLDLVRAGDYVVVDDIAASPMVTPSPGAGYRTVVAVAVTAGSLPLGLLTVDAPRPGDLGPTDVELLRVLANLLGAGLAQV
jgi:hypothetical protein